LRQAEPPLVNDCKFPFTATKNSSTSSRAYTACQYCIATFEKGNFMRSTLLSGACAASVLLALCSSAQAADIDAAPEPQGWGWYLSVFGGLSVPDDLEGSGEYNGTEFTISLELDNGFTFGGALGARLNDWLRAEAEVSGNWHDLSGYGVIETSQGDVDVNTDLSGDVGALFLLGNLWVEMPTGGPVKPYAGGGAGLGRIDLDGDAGWGFAYQAGAGVGLDLTQNVALDIGYRFKAINDADDTADYSSHNAVVGLRWGF
jgi:opacity protein-like surface antigen